MPTETLTYTYTSQAEIERLYGKTGVAQITADLQGSHISEWWTEIVADATTLVDGYLAQLYEPADLSTSRWVRTRATWIACFRLSQRKGNPDLFAQRYAEILEELNKAMAMEIMVPNIPTRSDLTPAMSNIVIDPRFEARKVRVQPEISTGGTGSRQDLSWDLFPTDMY